MEKLNLTNESVMEILKDILARLDRIDAKLDEAIKGGERND